MEEKALQALLQSMTLEEKIGQLVQLNGNFFDAREEIATGPASKIGVSQEQISSAGSILNSFGVQQLKEVQDRYLAANDKKIPLVFMADIINGFKTVFPISLGLGCSFDPELVKRTASIAAHEASVSGIHVTFSPMVDLVRDARWGRVMESYGEDVYLNSEYARAMVEGYQNHPDADRNIMACVKHFAAYGAPVGGREYNAVEMGERTLREQYLPSYQAAVDAGCELVMTSFNTIDGIPATGSSWLLRDILRKEWGFQGTVISDHSAVKELVPHGVAVDEKDAAKQAIEAGCDIDMMTGCYANHLKELVEEGSLPQSYIDEACYHVLQMKNKLGLFENPYRSADQSKVDEVVLCKEYREFAKEVVTKTCVLLKNEQVLPLAKDTSIALIGPYADYVGIFGMWSILTDIQTVVTVKIGMEQLVGKERIKTAMGAAFMDEQDEVASFAGMSLKLTSDDPQKDLEEALALAKEQDVIVLAMGEHAQMSGEGGARGELTLPKVQMNLLHEMKKLHKPIIVLLFNGRPLQVKEIEAEADAVLECWFPGIEGGNGIAELLYGVANPSARLAMSFPYAVGQCPVYYNELSTGRPSAVSKHSKRFTSRYIDIPNEPTHCFGYGLSYSEFHYDKLSLNTNQMSKDSLIEVSVQVSNISDIDGTETVQLYIRDLVGSVARPVKELKGVQKVFLKAKQTQTVTFEIKEEMLRFYDKNMQFVSEPGSFLVMVGKNANETMEESFQLV